MGNDEYEKQLRNALSDAEDKHARAMRELNASDAHPMSQEYKTAQWFALIAGGRVAGLAEALNLLTDEAYEPDLMPPGV